VVETTQLSILDTLGVALSATGCAPAAEAVLGYAGSTAAPEASVLLGCGRRAPAVAAVEIVIGTVLELATTADLGPLFEALCA
jgi:2-methylcitrate dehydratase PrpD